MPEPTREGAENINYQSILHKALTNIQIGEDFDTELQTLLDEKNEVNMGSFKKWLAGQIFAKINFNKEINPVIDDALTKEITMKAIFRSPEELGINIEVDFSSNSIGIEYAMPDGNVYKGYILYITE